jgi:hypothetical protein
MTGYTVKSDRINSFGESKKPMIWRNPTDNTLYASYKVPRLGFKEANAWAIYDLNAHASNVKLAQEGKQFSDNAFLDSEFANVAEQYIADVNTSGRVREAALRSSTNSAVDIVNIWTEVLGKRDRQYVAKNMTKEIPIPNLIIDIDTVTKFGGMVQIDEGQPGGIMKELTYSRAHFEAKKYGLKFVIHEEARLKNHHNVLQDSIQVASTKIEQRQSFDTVAALGTLSTVDDITAAKWDTTTTAGVYDNNPMQAIAVAQLNIEGSLVGGKMSRIGMHPLTYMKYNENEFLRGTASTTPVPYQFEPGTTTVKGVEGIGLVLDPSFNQTQAVCVSTEVEPTVAFFQGPQRIGSEHDQETGDDKYFIVDYHSVDVIQNETGRIIDNVIVPIDWT